MDILYKQEALNSPDLVTQCVNKDGIAHSAVKLLQKKKAAKAK